MRTRTVPSACLTALLALGILAPLASAAEPYWALTFENDTPKPLVLENVKNKLSFYWYLIYRVSNPQDKPITPTLKFTVKLTIAKQVSVYQDLFDTIAELYVEKKVAERPLCNWAELRATPLKPGEKREGVAIFTLGNNPVDFDSMAIAVRGLAEPRPLGREGNVRKFRERVLLLKYQYVPSRWRAGKELKYEPEEWTLEDVDVVDRASAEGDAPQDPSAKLKELLKKAEEERKRMESQEPKPPPKSSAAPTGPPMASGPRSGAPAPALLKALWERADKQPYARATFKERIGHGDRCQEAAGSIFLGKDERFATERLVNVGGSQALKERRIFDGKSLWIQTTAQGVGDTVRRWSVEATRKPWCTVDGRPEVDFATVANPVRAWRLFGDDLIYLGVEQLGGESAYVFEIRPGARYATVLGGPLSGELVGKAAGKRVRFWIGSVSAFQFRMQVRDDQDNVVALLECSDVRTDAVIDPARLAFTPPAGVEVIDMNAAMADNAASPTPSLP